MFQKTLDDPAAKGMAGEKHRLGGKGMRKEEGRALGRPLSRDESTAQRLPRDLTLCTGKDRRKGRAERAYIIATRFNDEINLSLEGVKDTLLDNLSTPKFSVI